MITGNLLVLVVLTFLVVRGDGQGWLPVALLAVLFILFADAVRRMR
jgi:hypothetical protein